MLRHIRVGMLFMSVCYLALGLLLLVLPQACLPWLCLGVSIAVLLTGLVNLVRYFRAERRSFAALCTLGGGAVTTALGIYTLLRPDSVRLILPLIFGLLILVDGILRIGAAFSLVRRARWQWLALLGLVSCLLGVLLIAQDTARLIAIIDDIILFSGILLVVEGALNLGCTVYIGMTRKELAEAEAARAQAQQPDAAPEPVAAAPTDAPTAAPDSAAPAETEPAAPAVPAEESAAHEG